MIIIATNRNPQKVGRIPFGETFNPQGPGELRFARAERETTTSEIKIDLVPEGSGETSAPPSKALFRDLIADIKAKKRGNKWLLYVHGYNNSFLESVNSALSLSETYSQNRSNSDLAEVNVILFSWPADPGGSIPVVTEPINSYRKIQRAAAISAIAFDRLRERLGKFFVQPAIIDSKGGLSGFVLNSIFHSMGSYMLETYVRDPSTISSELLFGTLTLHQPDVSLEYHAEWVDKISFAKNICITINQWDAVLRTSDAINSERLGTAQSDLTARKPMYFDFTGGKNVSSSHNIFLSIKENPIIKLLCHRLLVGYALPLIGLEGNGAFMHNVRSNSWQLADS